MSKHAVKRKGNRSPWVEETIAMFLKAKTIVSLHKDNKNRLEVLRLPGKTSASPCRRRDILAQISMDAFCCEGVTLIVDIVNMLSRKDHIRISAVPVCAVHSHLGSHVYHPLNGSGGFVPAHSMACDLLGLSTYHRHNVDIFPGCSPGFVLQKPV